MISNFDLKLKIIKIASLKNSSSWPNGSIVLIFLTIKTENTKNQIFKSVFLEFYKKKICKCSKINGEFETQSTSTLDIHLTGRMVTNLGNSNFVKKDFLKIFKIFSAGPF